MMNGQPRNRRKNQELCGKNFLKFVVYVFTFIFWLTGCAFLAIGVWILFVKHSFASLLGNSTFPIATYLMIGIGGFIVVTGIMGCAGARVENRCLLVLYSVFLLLIFLLEAISGVLAYMYEGIIREELSRSLNDTMMKNYNYDAHLTAAIDDMQQRFLCCGAVSFKDWQKSQWLREDRNTTNKAPDSCCMSYSQGCAISDHPSNIYYRGCSPRLAQYTKESLMIIGGVGLGLCCVQIFGVIFSCCLVRKIKDKVYKY